MTDNVIDFGSIHAARIATNRSLANFLWFYKFEMSWHEPGSKVAKEIENNPHRLAILREVKRRAHLGDHEAQEMLG